MAVGMEGGTASRCCSTQQLREREKERETGCREGRGPFEAPVKDFHRVMTGQIYRWAPLWGPSRSWACGGQNRLGELWAAWGRTDAQEVGAGHGDRQVLAGREGESRGPLSWGPKGLGGWGGGHVDGAQGSPSHPPPPPHRPKHCDLRGPGAVPFAVGNSMLLRPSLN